jgi:hypothetical protein
MPQPARLYILYFLDIHLFQSQNGNLNEAYENIFSPKSMAIY